MAARRLKVIVICHEWCIACWRDKGQGNRCHPTPWKRSAKCTVCGKVNLDYTWRLAVKKVKAFQAAWRRARIIAEFGKRWILAKELAKNGKGPERGDKKNRAGKGKSKAKKRRRNPV